MKSISFICLLIIGCFLIGNSFANDSIKSDEITCNLCNAVVGFAEKYVTTNATEQELIKKLDDYCGILPSEFSQSCLETVNNYGVLIIRLLINKEDADNICIMIELCPKSSSSSSSPSLFSIKENNNSNGTDCEICTFITKYAENLLEANKTIEDIVKVVDDFCKVLPSQYKTDCVAMASNYIPAIVKMLENNYNAEQVCQELSFCLPPPPPSTEGTTLCDICLDFANDAIEVVENSGDVETQLLKECKYFFSFLPTIENQCEKIISENFDSIVNEIQDHINPTSLCQNFLHICN
ncbi:hypothetical protein ACTFIW_001821 [Dictyostelium discoideum]